MRILKHKTFTKKLDKLPHPVQHKTIERLEIFVENPTHPILRNHMLRGKRVGFRSINITGDYRLIFRELSDNTYEIVELVNIGTHSQLYK